MRFSLLDSSEDFMGRSQGEVWPNVYTMELIVSLNLSFRVLQLLIKVNMSLNGKDPIS